METVTQPFSTLEPERYQALRVETTSEGAESVNTRTFIARDADRRREDYEVAGLKVSLLQLPGATFVLLPEKRLYAELKQGAEAANLPPDFSPDKLLNAPLPEARYEKLGAEAVNGRAAIKYRVTLLGAGREVVSESLIWVDEALGMPVKTEMTSTVGDIGAKYSMELQNIKDTVDAGRFDLPQDYSKVDFKEISSQLKAGAGTR